MPQAGSRHWSMTARSDSASCAGCGVLGLEVQGGEGLGDGRAEQLVRVARRLAVDGEQPGGPPLAHAAHSSRLRCSLFEVSVRNAGYA